MSSATPGSERLRPARSSTVLTGRSRVLSMAIVLLLAAAPLILFAEAVTQNAFGSGSSRQEIVDLFNSSRTIGQRVVIIVLAVVVAPFSEEFIFRFFIYGVLRRYFGIAIGLIFNSLLFACLRARAKGSPSQRRPTCARWAIPARMT